MGSRRSKISPAPKAVCSMAPRARRRVETRGTFGAVLLVGRDLRDPRRSSLVKCRPLRRPLRASRGGHVSGGSGGWLVVLEQQLSSDGSSGGLDTRSAEPGPRKRAGRDTTISTSESKQLFGGSERIVRRSVVPSGGLGLRTDMYERVTGLGWSDVPQSPSLAQWWLGLARPSKICLERTGGEQRCFADGESGIATNNDCERMNEACGGGNVWCCPRGFPERTAAANAGYVAQSWHIPGALALGVPVIFGVFWWFVASHIRSRRHHGVPAAMAGYV